MFKKILKVFMTLVMVISVASFHINNVEADSYKYEKSRDVFVADCIINGLLDKSGNRADTYSLISSTILHNYTYKTLAEALMDDKTLVFNSAFWTTVNNSLKGEFSTVFQQRKLFYETIIMDYLAYVDHSEEFESSFNEDCAKYEYDISKKLIEFANDNYENNLDELIENQSLSDAIEFSDKYGYISKLNKFSGLVDSIKEKATSAKEYYDGLKSALAIENANVSRVAFLKQMKGQAGENTDFCDAVDEIVGLYEGNYGSLVLYGVEDTAVKHLTEWAWKKLLGKLPSSVSATLDSIKLGQKTLDFIFNSNDTAENNLKLLILYIIGSYARESATHLRALFNGAQTATNGSNFVNGYLEYVIYQKYATELASGYVQESTYDGLWNQIKNSFNGTDTTYEQFKKYFDDDISISKNYIKQVINYYNLHNSYYGDFSDKSSEVVGSGTSSNINWNLNGNGVLTITGTGKMPNYGSSDPPWYKYKEVIRRVIVGEGITSIGNYAFCQYYNISKVTISSTVTSVGYAAFACCTSLIDVTIPKTVTTIRDYSFQDCILLESVVIEANSKKGFETVIGHSAFNGCKGLISVTIPSNVISIGNYAFSNCKSLEELTIPEGVKGLGIKIIADTYIEKIKIPSTVTYSNYDPYGETLGVLGALAGDAVLTEVEFAEGMRQIPRFICSGASSVERFVIPSTVTSIGDNASQRCTSLGEITLPEKLTVIGSSAFDGCKSLTSITIPGNVTSIGSNAFSNCNDLIAKVYNNSTGLTYCKNYKINYRIIGSFNKAHNIEVQNGTCTNIDESTELKVNELKEGNDYDVVSKSFDNFELYDIAFYKDDQKVTIDGTAVVRIPVEEGMDGNKCKVYYNDNGTFIDMGAIYKDGFMEFKTDHFSQYVITDSDLPTFTLGDVNEDDKIDFLDAITVLRYDAEIIQLTDNQMKAAEVNKDSKVDFLDAITILRYDAEIIDSFN